MYYVKYKKWWSTKTFGQAGRLFLESENTGKPGYCPFPKDTLSYREFWDEQIYYIHNGFYHEGQRIAGLHYLYQNYCPIYNKKLKKHTFPDFWALDADYFLHLERFLGIGIWENVEPYRPVTMTVSKTRQSGFSLKGAVPLIYNVQLVPASINYLGAWLEKDALKTLGMFNVYFNHQFKHTDFGKRWMKVERGKQYITGFYEEINQEKIPSGFGSELNIVTFKDNPEKGVGGGCSLFVIEEAGLHKALKTSVGFIEPACKDGDFTTGNILAYGAAGREISQDLEDMHRRPSAYGAYELDNVFDEPKHRMEEKTGYFVPDYSCRKGHLDEDGNPNPPSAIASRDKDHEKTKKKDYGKYLLDLSQHPNTPREMFNSQARKRFPTDIIDQWIAHLMSQGGQYGYPVTLYRSVLTGKVQYRMGAEHPQIVDYPLSEEADKHGCVVIYEDPPDIPEPGMYISSIDSYNQEQSFGGSLGCIYIYKRVTDKATGQTSRVIVAEFLGRPDTKIEFYETCRMLLELYGAVSLPENEDHELTPWFINNGCEHLLADQPDIIRQYIPNTSVKRSKGIHADDKLIIPAENKIYRYLTQQIGHYYNEQGDITGPKLGVTRILQLRLLRELREYSNETWKNFDCVRTFGWTLMYETETETLSSPTYDKAAADWITRTSRVQRSGSGIAYTKEERFRLRMLEKGIIVKDTE